MNTKKLLLAILSGVVLMSGCSRSEQGETSNSTTSITTTTTTTISTTTEPLDTASISTTTTTSPAITEPEETITPKSDEELNEYKNAVIEAIKNSVPYYAVFVENNKNGIHLSVQIDGADYITTLGNYIIDICTAFEEVFKDEETDGLEVVLFNGIDVYVMYRNTANDGKLSSVSYIDDYRSGEKETILLTSIDDLCDLFPATRQYINKSDIDSEKLAIYEEVMKALNEQYDRPEDEILSELAPNYGMTADELNQLLREVMAEIYS